MNRLFLFFLLLCSWACQSDPPPPQSPQDILKAYQKHIDNNEFEAARQLSTEAGKVWLTDLETIIAGEAPDSTLLTTQFLSIDCEEEGAFLICECTLKDQYEEYTAVYRLVKSEDTWLVDAPQDDIIIEDDVLEGLPDSMLEQILEETQE